MKCIVDCKFEQVRLYCDSSNMTSLYYVHVIILYLHQSEKSVSRHNRSPVSYKIKQEHVTVILDEIKKNKTITMEDLLALLHHKFPDLDLSRRHLARIVHDNNVSLKITRIRHEPSKRYGTTTLCKICHRMLVTLILGLLFYITQCFRACFI